MAKKYHCEWPQLIHDGGWQSKPSDGYFPVIEREVHGQLHQILNRSLAWHLYIDGIHVASGDLTEMLLRADQT